MKRNSPTPFLLAVTALLAGCGHSPVAVAPESAAPTSASSYLLGAEMAAAVDALAPLPSDVSSPPGETARALAGPADACLHWNERAVALAAEAKLPPPAFARVLALTSVACHDGIVAAARAGNAPLDGPCVVGAAACDVLAELFPASARSLEHELAADVAVVRRANPAGAQRGLAFGHLAGRVAVRIARRDGETNVFTGTMPTGDGVWTGTNPVLPACGTWRTWVATSGAEFAPPPPFRFGSAEDLADVAAVAAAAAARTPAQDAIIHKWADRSPPAIWNAMLREEITGRRLPLAEAARVQAFVNVAMHDAFVSCWRAKYTYWTARPFHRIPGLVTAIPTPNFPSYISGHSTISAAAAAVLAEAFPDQATHFHAEAEEAALSRLWAAIHFPQDNAQGLAVGRRLGAKVVAVMRAEDRPAL